MAAPRALVALAALVGFAGCSSGDTADPTSTIDEAVSCSLGDGDALVHACLAAGTPTPITAAPITSTTAPAIAADTHAYGIRLVARSASSFAGAVEFTPTQTATFQVYASSPNAGVRVLVPDGNGQAMASGCSSPITQTECSALRRVDSFSLVAGQHYRIEIGATSVSYIRLFIQTREPSPAVCEANELTELATACAATSEPDDLFTADPVFGNTGHNIAVDHVYGMQLPGDGLGNFGGTFAVNPPSDGDYEIYLGTPNIPLQVTEFFSHAEVATSCSRHIAASECDRLRRGDRFTLKADVGYRFDLGPIHTNNYVRVTIRRVVTETRIKLGTPVSYPTDATPNHLNHADLDNDGHVDLVAPVADDAGGTVRVEFLRNTGAGAFTTVNKVVWSVPGQNVIADFTGDGIVDIIGNAWDGQGPLNGYYMTGLGNVTYATTGWGNARDYLPYISSGDFDEDGVIDVVAPFVDSTSNDGPSGFVITLLPSFTVVQTELAFGHGTRQAVAGDFDGDGHQDVVVSSFTMGQLYLGDGTGHVTASGQPFAINGGELYADLNADGITDLVAVNAEPDIYYGSASGLSAPQRLTTGLTFGRGAAAGDFDHDGIMDLAIAGTDSDTSAAVSIVFGSATGFSTPTLMFVPDTAFAIDPTVGDFNGDGFSDLAVATQRGVSVFLSTP